MSRRPAQPISEEEEDEVYQVNVFLDGNDLDTGRKVYNYTIQDSHHRDVTNSKNLRAEEIEEIKRLIKHMREDNKTGVVRTSKEEQENRYPYRESHETAYKIQSKQDLGSTKAKMSTADRHYGREYSAYSYTKRDITDSVIRTTQGRRETNIFLGNHGDQSGREGHYERQADIDIVSTTRGNRDIELTTHLENREVDIFIGDRDRSRGGSREMHYHREVRRTQVNDGTELSFNIEIGGRRDARQTTDRRTDRQESNELLREAKEIIQNTREEEGRKQHDGNRENKQDIIIKDEQQRPPSSLKTPKDPSSRVIPQDIQPPRVQDNTRPRNEEPQPSQPSRPSLPPPSHTDSVREPTSHDSAKPPQTDSRPKNTDSSKSRPASQTSKTKTDYFEVFDPRNQEVKPAPQLEPQPPAQPSTPTLDKSQQDKHEHHSTVITTTKTEQKVIITDDRTRDREPQPRDARPSHELRNRGVQTDPLPAPPARQEVDSSRLDRLSVLKIDEQLEQELYLRRQLLQERLARQEAEERKYRESSDKKGRRRSSIDWGAAANANRDRDEPKDRSDSRKNVREEFRTRDDDIHDSRRPAETTPKRPIKNNYQSDANKNPRPGSQKAEEPNPRHLSPAGPPPAPTHYAKAEDYEKLRRQMEAERQRARLQEQQIQALLNEKQHLESRVNVFEEKERIDRIKRGPPPPKYPHYMSPIGNQHRYTRGIDRLQSASFSPTSFGSPQRSQTKKREDSGGKIPAGARDDGTGVLKGRAISFSKNETPHPQPSSLTNLSRTTPQGTPGAITPKSTVTPRGSVTPKGNTTPKVSTTPKGNETPRLPGTSPSNAHFVEPAEPKQPSKPSPMFSTPQRPPPRPIPTQEELMRMGIIPRPPAPVPAQSYYRPPPPTTYHTPKPASGYLKKTTKIGPDGRPVKTDDYAILKPLPKYAPVDTFKSKKKPGEHSPDRKFPFEVDPEEHKTEWEQKTGLIDRYSKVFDYQMSPRHYANYNPRSQHTKLNDCPGFHNPIENIAEVGPECRVNHCDVNYGHHPGLSKSSTVLGSRNANRHSPSRGEVCRVKETMVEKCNLSGTKSKLTRVVETTDGTCLLTGNRHVGSLQLTSPCANISQNLGMPTTLGASNHMNRMMHGEPSTLWR
jgi:hypothetical protein